MDPFTLALLGSSAASVASGGLGFLGSQRAAGAQQQAAQTSGLYGLIAQQQAIQAQQEAQRQGAAALEKGSLAYDPYTQFGSEATNRYATLMGLRPGADSGSLMRQPTAAELEMDPGYAFRMQQGMKALDRSASARGGLMSGGALKGIADYSQGLASQEYGNAYNRFMANRANVINMLQGGVGTGLSAASGKGQLAGQAANLYSGTGQNIANTMLMNPYGQAAENIGQARASGYMGGATALSQALQSPMQNYMAYSMMNRFAPQTAATQQGFGAYGPQPAY
jgi:hypothetical protein